MRSQGIHGLAWSAGLLILVLFAVTLASPPAVAGRSSLDWSGLGEGPHARMEGVLEETFLNVDAAHAAIRFDPHTARRIGEAVRGHAYSEARARRVARVAVEAEQAMIRTEMLRDVDVERFVETAREDLRAARQAGFIDALEEERAANDVKRAFTALRDRGLREGDVLFYRVRSDGLRTLLRSANDETLVDRSQHGTWRGRLTLASYLAPGTGFHEPLVRSSFGNE